MDRLKAIKVIIQNRCDKTLGLGRSVYEDVLKLLDAREAERLKKMAKILKDHCEQHNFYAADMCEGCVFAEHNEECPFDGGVRPADWSV